MFSPRTEHEKIRKADIDSPKHREQHGVHVGDLYAEPESWEATRKAPEVELSITV
jgi:hypothetical protein